MRFRPCIDIHNGKVKQIIGGSLRDQGDFAEENYVSERSAADFARLYHADGLKGGHIILLNPASSPCYEDTKKQAMEALEAEKGDFSVGGGISPDNASEFLDAGASQVIVTSYVFSDGHFHEDHLQQMVSAVGRDRLILDLSCRKKDGRYFIVTDRWQKFTDVRLTEDTLRKLSGFCSEFLVHAVDAEGKRKGPELDLVDLLSGCPISVTYAGGIGSFQDLRDIRQHGCGRIDVTIGSALDLFGGSMSYREVLNFMAEEGSQTGRRAC